ncbi:hypothetical protein KL929_002502 [Ogataea haglerorum]|nr:hypothetical protein KL929_002502 [Ogataea haglerorum]
MEGWREVSTLSPRLTAAYLRPGRPRAQEPAARAAGAGQQNCHGAAVRRRARAAVARRLARVRVLVRGPETGAVLLVPRAQTACAADSQPQEGHCVARRRRHGAARGHERQPAAHRPHAGHGVRAARVRPPGAVHAVEPAVRGAGACGRRGGRGGPENVAGAQVVEGALGSALVDRRARQRAGHVRLLAAQGPVRAGPAGERVRPARDEPRAACRVPRGRVPGAPAPEAAERGGDPVEHGPDQLHRCLRPLAHPPVPGGPERVRDDVGHLVDGRVSCVCRRAADGAPVDGPAAAAAVLRRAFAGAPARVAGRRACAARERALVRVRRAVQPAQAAAVRVDAAVGVAGRHEVRGRQAAAPDRARDPARRENHQRVHHRALRPAQVRPAQPCRAPRAAHRAQRQRHAVPQVPQRAGGRLRRERGEGPRKARDDGQRVRVHAHGQRRAQRVQEDRHTVQQVRRRRLRLHVLQLDAVLGARVARRQLVHERGAAAVPLHSGALQLCRAHARRRRPVRRLRPCRARVPDGYAGQGGWTQRGGGQLPEAVQLAAAGAPAGAAQRRRPRT